MSKDDKPKRKSARDIFEEERHPQGNTKNPPPRSGRKSARDIIQEQEEYDAMHSGGRDRGLER